MPNKYFKRGKLLTVPPDLRKDLKIIRESRGDVSRTIAESIVDSNGRHLDSGVIGHVEQARHEKAGLYTLIGLVKYVVNSGHVKGFRWKTYLEELRMIEANYATEKTTKEVKVQHRDVQSTNSDTRQLLDRMFDAFAELTESEQVLIVNLTQHLARASKVAQAVGAYQIRNSDLLT